MDYKQQVDAKLMKQGLTRKWLIKQFRDSTGMFMDKAYLCRILSGERNSKVVKDFIRDKLGVTDEDAG
jgi:hypothetical protein